MHLHDAMDGFVAHTHGFVTPGDRERPLWSCSKGDPEPRAEHYQRPLPAFEGVSPEREPVPVLTGDLVPAPQSRGREETYTIRLKVDTFDVEAFIEDMREAVARALCEPTTLLAIGRCFPCYGRDLDPELEQRGRNLLTVAAFPHTPE